MEIAERNQEFTKGKTVVFSTLMNLFKDTTTTGTDY